MRKVERKKKHRKTKKWEWITDRERKKHANATLSLRGGYTVRTDGGGGCVFFWKHRMMRVFQ